MLNTSGLGIAKVMHNVVLFKTKSIIAKVNFFVKNANKVTIIDNQQCINVHIYVMKNWKHIPILLVLEKVEVGAILNNITIVISKAMANYKGLTNDDMASKWIYLGCAKNH